LFGKYSDGQPELRIHHLVRDSSRPKDPTQKHSQVIYIAEIELSTSSSAHAARKLSRMAFDERPQMIFWMPFDFMACPVFSSQQVLVKNSHVQEALIHETEVWYIHRLLTELQGCLSSWQLPG
jgi:hypothetical protein